jgi:hypothetical protein
MKNRPETSREETKLTNLAVHEENEDPKAFLFRWLKEDSSGRFRLKFQLWEALQQEGFSEIELRAEDYESCEDLWRFSFKIGVNQPVSSAIERRVRAACASIGFAVEKDFVAAVVEGGQAKGRVTLRKRVQVPNP